MGEGQAAAGAYGMDPEDRHRGNKYPGEKRRKKEGWFSGRITWVVYFLTLVQIGVFVGEIIKNGMFMLILELPLPGISGSGSSLSG